MLRVVVFGRSVQLTGVEGVIGLRLLTETPTTFSICAPRKCCVPRRLTCRTPWRKEQIFLAGEGSGSCLLTAF
jgi:hypothetical protein